jgi:hypothetical protein
MEPTHVPLPWFIYGLWAIVGTVTFVSIGVALYLGLRGRGTALGWRVVKLASNFSGVIGILFLMLTLENVARQGFVGEIPSERILAFIQLRSLVLAEMAMTCPKGESTPSRACSQLKGFAQSSDWIEVRDRMSLTVIRHKEQYDPSLSGFFDQYNFLVQQVNLYAERKEDRYPTMSQVTRINLFLLAGLFMALALAGSIGESAFQLRKEMAEGDKGKKS